MSPSTVFLILLVSVFLTLQSAAQQLQQIRSRSLIANGGGNWRKNQCQYLNNPSCPSGTQCCHLHKQQEAFRYDSAEGYELIQVRIANNRSGTADLDGNDRCHLFYIIGQENDDSNAGWVKYTDVAVTNSMVWRANLDSTADNNPIIGFKMFANTDMNDYCLFNFYMLSGIPIETDPTKAPTPSPTPIPTDKPTSSPSPSPSPSPTPSPTTKPTDRPTNKPSPPPSPSPIKDPTRKRTAKPTNKPTDNPTDEPTKPPSYEPTRRPTVSPTSHPSNDPTHHPTVQTYEPSIGPSNSPTSNPTDIAIATAFPSFASTARPSTPQPTLISIKTTLTSVKNDEGSVMEQEISDDVKTTNHKDARIEETGFENNSTALYILTCTLITACVLICVATILYFNHRRIVRKTSYHNESQIVANLKQNVPSASSNEQENQIGYATSGGKVSFEICDDDEMMTPSGANPNESLQLEHDDDVSVDDIENVDHEEEVENIDCIDVEKMMKEKAKTKGSMHEKADEKFKQNVMDNVVIQDVLMDDILQEIDTKEDEGQIELFIDDEGDNDGNEDEDLPLDDMEKYILTPQ